MRQSPQVLEWQMEARMETRAEDVRRAIRLRFATPMPADLEDQLAAIKKESELDRWFEASQTAPSLDAFRAAIQNGRRKRQKVQMIPEGTSARGRQLAKWFCRRSSANRRDEPA